ncbi:MAG: acyl-CoA dehydrogenase family protein [Deltaproteobacteria bacterium]|nr:acyl-CoA dehydrogenase family protein [Deltaproteobacteria bacterium]
MSTREEQRSLKMAESAREADWREGSFLRDLFLGRLRLELIEPYPLPGEPRPEFAVFREKLRRFLEEEVDAAQIDRRGEYPARVILGLRSLGAFGMKVPVEYGVLGLSAAEYIEIMKLVGSWDGNVTALLSAHQSIGVPRPLTLFGSEALKRKYLPRCAAGSISAFALTETEAGSDPARIATTATPTPDGRAFILNGAKLWCTNGTLADLLVVMARDPRTEAISAFVVETGWEGVAVTHRCRFMGLKALANAALRFHEVRVPRENLIGEEGKGLKVALTTLNTGRLALPAATVGLAKTCLELCRKWARARSQWGVPIGRHEAIAHKLAEMASTTFAMESVCDLVAAMADSPDHDIRLEAAAAKEWNTVRAWRMVDDALQIRGGRGFETEESLAGRGEAAVGVERWLRDSRINRIFEGSSEIMHLFMAREAVDRHLQVAGALVDPERRSERLAALPKIAAFYGRWYPSRWVGWGHWPRFSSYGALAGHVRFIERASRKLARASFHGMVRFGAGAQRRQAFLFRLVDLAMELFAMSATVGRARRLAELRRPEAEQAVALADLFCRSSRREVSRLFRALAHNDDVLQSRLGREVFEGREAWLEQGAMGLGLEVGELSPLPVSELMVAQAPIPPPLETRFPLHEVSPPAE